MLLEHQAELLSYSIPPQTYDDEDHHVNAAAADPHHQKRLQFQCIPQVIILSTSVIDFLTGRSYTTYVDTAPELQRGQNQVK